MLKVSVFLSNDLCIGHILSAMEVGRFDSWNTMWILL